MSNQHSKCDDCYKTHLPEAHDRIILPSEAFGEGYVPEFNQASEYEPINQHLVCLWQLQDIEETIADATPEELVDLHSKLVALSTDITEAVQSLIRTEKLKAVSENEKIREMLNDPEVIGKAAKGAIKAQRKMAGLESEEN